MREPNGKSPLVWSAIPALLFSMMALARVDLRTNIQDVYYRGPAEEAGAITFAVADDCFSMASPETPVYLRVTLDKDARLGCSLVDLTQAGDLQQPIYLAMRREGYGDLVAPPDTVSIVRMIQGERALWIKIQRSSSTWYASSHAPKRFSPTAFTLGVSARSSHTANLPLFNSGAANLPSNTMNTDDMGLIADYASTLLCVDLSQSTLLPENTSGNSADSGLSFSVEAFDHTTVGVESVPDPQAIVPGVPLNVVFLGDTVVARGIDQYISASSDGFTPGQAGVCDQTSLVMIEADPIIQLSFDYGINPGSEFTWENIGSVPAGFLVDTDAANLPVLAFTEDDVDYYYVLHLGADILDTVAADEFIAVAPEHVLFQSHQTWLASTASIIHQGFAVHDSHTDIAFSVRVFAPPETADGELDFLLHASLTNHGSPLDDFPYNLDHQNYLCPQFQFHAEDMSLRLGIVYPCMPSMALLPELMPQWPRRDISQLITGQYRRFLLELEDNNRYDHAMALKPAVDGWNLNLLGSIDQSDQGEVINELDYGGDDLEDLFQITLDLPMSLLIAVEPLDQDADLDLFVFRGEQPNGSFFLVDSLLDPDMDVAASSSGCESVARELPAGTYYIAVSLFEGDAVAQTDYGLLITQTPQLFERFESEESVTDYQSGAQVAPDDTSGWADWSFSSGFGDQKPGGGLLQFSAQHPEIEHSGLISPRIFPVSSDPVRLDFDLVALFPTMTSPFCGTHVYLWQTGFPSHLSGFQFLAGEVGTSCVFNGQTVNSLSTRWVEAMNQLGDTAGYTLPSGVPFQLSIMPRNQGESWLIDNLRIYHVATTHP